MRFGSLIVVAAIVGIASISLGIPDQDERGVDLRNGTAEHDDPAAQFALGQSILSSDGDHKNIDDAVKWFTRSALGGHAPAQLQLGRMYCQGQLVAKNEAEAVRWFTMAAERGEIEAESWLGSWYGTFGANYNASESVRWMSKAAVKGCADSQSNLGAAYQFGLGVPVDVAEAVRWYTKAADQDVAVAQYNLGSVLLEGRGVPKDVSTAAKWLRKAAEQGFGIAQLSLAELYAEGKGVPQNFVQAYAWASIAAANGQPWDREWRDKIAERMSVDQIAEGQRIAAAFVPRAQNRRKSGHPAPAVPARECDVYGSGFFITTDGAFMTNYHVVKGARQIRVRTSAGMHTASIVQVDSANDLALLKVEGDFPALFIRGSAGVQASDRVSTVGYPNPELQGLAAKFSSGEIASITGPNDDPTLFQISVPIQPGNSGGPLVDSTGSVVGVVVAQLDKLKAFDATGALPENVNYAVKGTILLALLESVPGIKEKLVPHPAAPALHASVAREVAAATGMVMVDR